MIIAVAAVRDLELPAFASQSVDATLEINVQSRAIVDRQRLLSRDIGVCGIRRMLQAPLINFQEAREVNGRFGNRNLAQQRAVHAVLRADEITVLRYGKAARKDSAVLLVPDFNGLVQSDTR